MKTTLARFHRPLFAVTTVALLSLAAGCSKKATVATQAPAPRPYAELSPAQRAPASAVRPPPPRPAAPPPAAPIPAAVAPPPVAAPPVAAAPPPTSNLPRVSPAALAAYQAGVAAFQAGQLPTAKAQLTKATQLDSKAYMAHAARGAVLERMGDLGGAETAYGQALLIVPDYGPAIRGRGLLLLRAGRAGRAERVLNEGRAKQPDSAAIIATLAEVKSVEGDSAAAQRLASEALKKDPDYRPAMVTIARDHFRQRRVDLALYTLKAILDGFGEENPPRDPNNGEARLLRAQILRSQGSRSEAIEEYEKVVRLRPDLVEANVTLASYVLEAGNAQRATQLLERALQYDPNNVEARLNLGDAYRVGGRISDAERELLWVRQRSPNSPEAHYNLGLLYLFSEQVPGKTSAQAANAAVQSFEAYQKLRPRGVPGDGIEELITRARSRKAVVEAESEQTSASDALPNTWSSQTVAGGRAS